MAASLDPSLRAAVRALRRLAPRPPGLALILGSGFQAIAENLPPPRRLAYQDIPGFPPTRVPGHAGEVLATEMCGLPLLLLCGRPHYYEGHSLNQVTFPVRVLAAMGVRALLLTNAAGGLHPRWQPGDFMALTDHINFMGENPLRALGFHGAADFVDLTRAYDDELLGLLRRSARLAQVPLRTGTYLAVSGPSYETPAEIRAFRRLGADAVGMSTVPEVIVARRLGMRVAALSCITNHAASRRGRPLSHAEVLAAGRQQQHRAAALLEKFVSLFARATPGR